MAPTTIGQAPSLSTFINKSLNQNDIDTSIELLISLLKRRQIRNSRPCAIATAELFLRIVGAERIKDAQRLIDRIRHVGRRLAAAQPREMAVGNVVRRILGVVREVAEDEEDGRASEGESDLSASQTLPTVHDPQRPLLHSTISTFSPLHQGVALPAAMQVHPTSSPDTSPPAMDPTARRPQMPTMTSYAGQGPQPSSLLSFLEHPPGKSPYSTPPSIAQSPKISPSHQHIPSPEKERKVDIKGEVINGIQDLIEELQVVDAQIAESALDHIHSNEIILTHTSSQTVQKFLATAARKRTFTVIHAEAYPHDHDSTHATIVNGAQSHDPDAPAASDERWRPLTSLGVTVILIPDTAVVALMSRINKVILAPHTVLANGSLLAAAGAAAIAAAAKSHRVPVVVLSGVYKLSPVYPFDAHELIEYGDPGKVVPFADGEFMDKVDVVNPVYDWVEAGDVDLYITNLGGCAPSFLYRIVADHYRAEDIEL